MVLHLRAAGKASTELKITKSPILVNVEEPNVKTCCGSLDEPGDFFFPCLILKDKIEL